MKKSSCYVNVTIGVGADIAKILLSSGLSLTYSSHFYNIAYEIRRNKKIFKSTSSCITKSIDYFIKMKDESLGAIVLFVRNGQQIYLLLKKYEISHKKYHLNEIQLKKPIQHQLYNCDEICEKLIYLRFGNIEVTTSEPNKYVVV